MDQGNSLFTLTEAGETGQMRVITHISTKQRTQRIGPDIRLQRTVRAAYCSVKSEAFNSKSRLVQVTLIPAQADFSG